MISLSSAPRPEDEEFVYNAMSYAAVQLGRDCPNSNITFSTHSYEEDEFDVPPAEELYYDDQTLFKVYSALQAAGLNEGQIRDAVAEMQNAGILFRERKR
jgi:hypothetical protein